MVTTLSAAQGLIDAFLDDGSFESWDQPAVHVADPEYQEQLRRAAERSGTDEAVLTGRGTVHGRPVVVLVSEFAFLAGSIGRVAAERITSAVRRATAEGLPIVASTASGGTRVQEGAPAFVEMISISTAIMAHKAAGLPYLVHLRHPTTGGVFASWGSLGHVTVAEPGALTGFLGPKVFEALHGAEFPEGVQTAENLAAHGVIDGVVSMADLPVLLDRALGVLVDPPVAPRLPRRTGSIDPGDAWASVLRTRRPERAGVRDLLRYGATGTVRLTEPDASVLVALTRLDGQPCVVVGQDRSQSKPMGPAALRQARRGMNLAESLGLPLVTVIDTPGAELSPAAEEGGLAGEIAQCIATLATLTVPTLAILLGQGTGGGALALLPAKTVIAPEHAWLAPLPPEGASQIVHHDVEHAAAMARQQRISALDLHVSRMIHQLIPENDADTAQSLAVAVVAEAAAQLSRQSA
ncbi:acetyl-CoA carboxyl transferase [Kribbella sandramycini]|uniref:Acetyl-CoA carboxyl transferase n=1 Tax=Kribbella sandramycini TaxID=60450 RepID=A0A7Y4KWL2_9ACTN|nr:carboxyl transferase domain-containing protein [Kribbella sandramycini]MBB6567452.1 acetyl-CoA carboxylase carboxyl transferase subunit beta [Kribbella sandramycini]NOL39939.1 acetyl-CoA carboxyl transferase [Kribbella sandramycini]